MATHSPTARISHPVTTSLLANLITAWHLLSLDAPTVATLWTSFIARVMDIRLSASSLFAIFLAVWAVYASDRLLDVRHRDPRDGGLSKSLEARHLFHLRHRQFFLGAIFLAALALIPLIVFMPPAVRDLYLVAGALLLAWLARIHVRRRSESTPESLPKEMAVGFFFSAAIFIPNIAQKPPLLAALFLPALLFANLCFLNCLFIFAWEHHDPTQSTLRAHGTTRFGIRFLKPIAVLSCGVPLLLLLREHALSPILTALSLAPVLLLLLHRLRHRLAPITLRAAADLALLTPLLILPFLP